MLRSASGWISEEMVGRNASALSETERGEECIISFGLKYVTAVSEKSLKKGWKPGHWSGLFAPMCLPRFGQGEPGSCSLCWSSAATLSCLRAGGRWNQGLISDSLYHFYCSSMSARLGKNNAFRYPVFLIDLLSSLFLLTKENSGALQKREVVMWDLCHSSSFASSLKSKS